MVVFNNQTVSRIEGAANAFLQRMIDCEFPFSRLFPQAYKSFMTSNRHLAFCPAVQTKKERLCASKRGPLIRAGQYRTVRRVL